MNQAASPGWTAPSLGPAHAICTLFSIFTERLEVKAINTIQDRQASTVFFKDYANVKAAQTLWARLARHFRGNTTVAGYDLLNEPTGAPTSDTMYVVQDGLYRAVRTADPDHIVFIEDGYTGIQWMPYPEPSGWTNVAYSIHYYNFDAKTAEDQAKISDETVERIRTEREKRHAPYYLGEFCMEPHGSIDTLAHFVGAMQSESISYSTWTYKVMWTGGGQSQWGLYSNVKPVNPLDPYQDSEATLIEKCQQLKTANLDEYQPMTAVFKATVK